MSIISFGAGVNSTALIIIMVKQGWHGPILFADTGAEWPETYCFIDYFEREWLMPRGLTVTRLDGTYRAHVPRCNTRTLIEYCEHYRYTPSAGTRWCTIGWKIDPQHHWCKEHGETEQMIGISAEEAHRAKGRLCPLIDMGIDRDECKRIIRAEGLPVPMRSGCYVCPFQRKAQFRELYRLHPDLFERAARLEELSSERRGVQAHIRVGGEWTLRQLEREFSSQTRLFSDDEYDGFREYQPCVCRL